MKKNIFVCLFIFIIYHLIGQVGFNKKYSIDYGNTFMGSIIDEDTLCIIGTSNNLINGWQGNFITFDTNGYLLSKNYFKKDSINHFVWAGENSKLIINEYNDIIIAILKDALKNELEILYMDSKGMILNKISYKLNSNNNEYYRIFSVINVPDGFLISGTIQYSSYTVKSFILKIDKEGDEIYFKEYGEKDYWFTGSTLYHSPVNENEVVLFGRYTTNSIGYISYQVIDHFTGDIIRTEESQGGKDNIIPYGLYFSEYYNSIIGVGSARNEDNTEWVPGLVVYDNSFNVIRKELFGIRTSSALSLGYQENPYQSTQDSVGNIYAATTQYLPIPNPDSTAQYIEAISITKFDEQHNHLWTTIDTVFYDGVQYGYAGYISGISVSSTGSVFITGYYNGPNPEENNKWRSTAYLLKYDKDGCRISGCRIVDTDEHLQRKENLIVYPNPSYGTFILKLPQEVSRGHIIVTNINGQIILQKEIKNNSYLYEIDITDHPSGRYNIEVYPDDNKDRVFYGVQVVKL